MPLTGRGCGSGVRTALELADHPELRAFMGNLLDPTEADLATDDALDRWLMREATTYSHISCTCRMGPEDDDLAVVDQFGRVYGVERLRIVDASIMPDLVRAPINPAVLMLAERIANAMRAGIAIGPPVKAGSCPFGWRNHILL